METLFRLLRINCKISLKEVARAANISHQRLSQIELPHSAQSHPKNQEKFIMALETTIKERKKALETAEFICKNKRNHMFDIKEEDDFESILHTGKLY